MKVEIECQHVGQALHALRVVSGLRGYECAARAGCHPATLAAIERGRKPCSPTLEARIRRAISEGVTTGGCFARLGVEREHLEQQAQGKRQEIVA